MKNSGVYLLFLFLIAALLTVNGSRLLWLNAGADRLSSFSPRSSRFREMDLSGTRLKELKKARETLGLPSSELLALSWFCQNLYGAGKFLPRNEEEYLRMKKAVLSFNRTGYETLQGAYEAVWDDAEVFPVPGTQVSYENSWMFERTYGGIRGHEGTDLMPPENLPGSFEVASITAGTVEKIGWLEKGGYRIGIRSPRGGYYYYAHLDSYAREFVPGDQVEAGEILGYMGDTGYGPEGTRGRFETHLHLGIYLETEEQEELSVNPYWVLRLLEEEAGRGGGM